MHKFKKNLILVPFIILFTFVSEAKKHSVTQKVVLVNGMVCAFCSNSIEKKLKKESAVQAVKVDLEHKKVVLSLDPQQNLSDHKIKKIIQSSGFKVVSITTASNTAIINEERDPQKKSHPIKPHVDKSQHRHETEHSHEG